MADQLEASIRIAAPPEVVFDYFTTPSQMVRWMGDYANLDPMPGGVFHLDINGVPVRGHYVEIESASRLVISWGHAGSESFPPDASRLEITLTPEGDGTVVEVVHRGLPDEDVQAHARGWRHFLDRLGIAASGGDPGPDPWASSPPGHA